MRLLTLDPSKNNAGWATMAGRRIDCGSYSVPGEFDPEIFSNFERWWWELIQSYANTPEPVTHVAIERVQPSGNAKLEKVDDKKDLVGGNIKIKQFTNFDAEIYLLGFRAIAMSKVHQAGVPLFMPTVGEWRKSFYGKGTKPPPDRNTPAKRKLWWKKLAIQQCANLKITAPDADAAEAVGISFWLRAQLQHESFVQGRML